LEKLSEKPLERLYSHYVRDHHLFEDRRLHDRSALLKELREEGYDEEYIQIVADSPYYSFLPMNILRWSQDFLLIRNLVRAH
jgi:hypothetical protein